MDRVGPVYASMEEDRFRGEMHANCLELGMESPIEDLFWIACWLLCKANRIELNPGPDINAQGKPELMWGVYINPQFKVGKYRVDFQIFQVGIGPDEILTPVIVELDGHDFHDKDKRQRSYEKARDRALVKAGYRVLHFTGSDVVKDPFACAFEALDMVGLFAGRFIDEYDPADPLGLGCE
jgi:very-short-patch-repair endonuclease